MAKDEFSLNQLRTDVSMAKRQELKEKGIDPLSKAADGKTVMYHENEKIAKETREADKDRNGTLSRNELTAAGLEKYIEIAEKARGGRAAESNRAPNPGSAVGTAQAATSKGSER